MDLSDPHNESNYNELPRLAADLLQTTINSALRYDPGTRAALQALPETPLAIISLRPELRLYVHTRNDQLVFQNICHETPAVELSGNLLDILSLVFTAKTSLANTGVTVKGSIGLLADYQRCFQNIDIDWEDALASLLGSLPAHQAMKLGRYFLNNMLPGRAASAAWLSDFIVEELQSVPSSAQLQQFSQEVHQTRQGTERLELRLKKLLQQQQ